MLVCFSLLVPATSECLAATPDANESACKKFVQSFYDWYSAAARKDNSDIGFEQVVKYKKGTSFTAELRSLLQEDARAQAKVKGEIVGLDFDPFLSTNAEPAGKYIVENVLHKNNSYLASVFAFHAGKKTPKPIAVPELILRKGEWQFANFHYVDSSAENENLVGILKLLQKDRLKYK